MSKTESTPDVTPSILEDIIEMKKAVMEKFVSDIPPHVIGHLIEQGAISLYEED